MNYRLYYCKMMLNSMSRTIASIYITPISDFPIYCFQKYNL